MYKKRSVFVCSGCSNPIFEGDIYYDIMGEQLCERCIQRAKSEAVFVDETD